MLSKINRITFCFLLLVVILQQETRSQNLSFEKFLSKLVFATDSSTKSRMIDEYLMNKSIPILEGNTAYFIYRGKASIVEMPGEFNEWNPEKTRMVKIPETNLFLHIEDIPLGGRMEYKFRVDGNWVIDPMNPKKSQGGMGENSEVWSSTYTPPRDINVQAGIPHGRLDTIWFESKVLKRTHPIFVYTPPGVNSENRIPTIYVTDGGEYLSLGLMKNVLDNLIFQKRIRPVMAVFIDPRTNLQDNSTNQRMTDYAASDTYLDFLQNELATSIEHTYPASRSANDRLIMGASMGGLISTYAVMLRSKFVKNCAAQSPSYQQAENAIVKLFNQLIRLDVNVYMDAGTIKDTQTACRLISELLRKKGATVNYTEYPEGHNWSNWRARIDDILEYFFPLN